MCDNFCLSIIDFLFTDNVEDVVYVDEDEDYTEYDEDEYNSYDVSWIIAVTDKSIILYYDVIIIKISEA